MKKDNSKLWLAQLRSGGQLTINKRDYLLVQQYAQDKGMEIEVKEQKGVMMVIKAK